MPLSSHQEREANRREAIMNRQTIAGKHRKVGDSDSWARHPRKEAKGRTARKIRRKAKEVLRNW